MVGGIPFLDGFGGLFAFGTRGRRVVILARGMFARLASTGHSRLASPRGAKCAPDLVVCWKEDFDEDYAC